MPASLGVLVSDFLGFEFALRFVVFGRRSPRLGPVAVSKDSKSSSARRRASASCSASSAMPVGDGDLVIIGMDFREGEEALAVSAIFDEGRLQRRLYARHLGEIDIAFERPLGGGLEIKFLDFLTVENDHPGFFRVAGIDKHALGH